MLESRKEKACQKGKGLSSLDLAAEQLFKGSSNRSRSKDLHPAYALEGLSANLSLGSERL